MYSRFPKQAAAQGLYLDSAQPHPATQCDTLAAFGDAWRAGFSLAPQRDSSPARTQVRPPKLLEWSGVCSDTGHWPLAPFGHFAH
jgi:hypothetical protein